LPTLYYATLDKSQVINYTVVNSDGTTSLKSITKDGTDNGQGQYTLANASFRIEKDHWGNHKLFSISGN